MTRPRLILAFAVAFAVLILAPAFLHQPFPLNRLMDCGDALDLLTPLVMLPLYWLLFTDAGRRTRGRRATLTFLVFGALWILGQGMHLSANSIGNLMGHGESPTHNLVHFYDEVLSHYIWHVAIIGMSVILVVGRREPEGSAPPTSWGRESPSGFLYGFTYFCAVNEGGTVPLGLPAAIVIPAAILVTRRGGARRGNLTTFFFLGYVIALAFFVGWFARWGGFPEFSEKGII